jgi:hypothetical protein
MPVSVTKHNERRDEGHVEMRDCILRIWRTSEKTPFTKSHGVRPIMKNTMDTRRVAPVEAGCDGMIVSMFDKVRTPYFIFNDIDGGDFMGLVSAYRPPSSKKFNLWRPKEKKVH